MSVLEPVGEVSPARGGGISSLSLLSSSSAFESGSFVTFGILGQSGKFIDYYTLENFLFWRSSSKIANILKTLTKNIFECSVSQGNRKTTIEPPSSANVDLEIYGAIIFSQTSLHVVKTLEELQMKGMEV